ncbi:GspE/PulE family protein [Thermodesulfobacteriota bacterium]
MHFTDNHRELFVDAIKQIQLCIKSTASYPEDHPISHHIINKSYETLASCLNKRTALNISVFGNKLLVNNVPLDSKNTFCIGFQSSLEQRDIDSINFYDGLTMKEFMIFLNAMIKNPGILKQNGGVASILHQHGVSTIKLNNVKYGKIAEGSKEIEKDHIVTHLDKGSDGLIDKDLETEKPDKTSDPAYDLNSEDESENFKEDIANLLSKGKISEIQTIIKDLTKRLDDSSWKIRKKVADNFLEITSALDEFDKLKESFRGLSEVMIKRAKQESHVDAYLTVSENLRQICTSQDRNESYFIDETIGDRLFKADKLSTDQLQKVLMARKKNGKSLQYNLAALNCVDETVLTQFIAQQYKGCRTTSLSNIHQLPENIIKTIPVKFIKRYLILPLSSDFGNLSVATMNPNDLEALNDIQFISGYSIVPFLASEYNLLNSIEKFYHVETMAPEGNRAMEDIQKENDFEFVEGRKEESIDNDELKDSDAPVVRLVNLVLKEAVTQKASDIHIEPFENEMRVRFRCDGTLTTLLTPSIRYAKVIPSRIKIMAGLDISERRLPQDGRFKIRMSGNYVDFRVSTFPGIFGEKVVLRLLDNSNIVLDPTNLGFHDNDLNSLLTAMYKSKGMILVTGPTGSGKTTTLYSMLNGLNDGTRNISTAEDPIEYNLKGINQFQMNPKIGLGFARALRTLLRQDPDIIMVGEMRDFETAETATKAALTGHLVLSTLHTNSAPETITRLLDIGIEPYLITSSLNLIIAQRLMRKICDKCKVETTPNDLQLKLLNNSGFDILDHRLYIGNGCEECNHTGYRGRIAIYEVMPMWDDIQELILKKRSSFDLRKKAEELGLVNLQEQGFNKVIEGITSLDEWMRVVA